MSEMKILYFAWLRGKTGTNEESVTPPASVTDVAGLIDGWVYTAHAELPLANCLPRSASMASTSSTGI